MVRHIQRTRRSMGIGMIGYVGMPLLKTLTQSFWTRHAPKPLKKED